MAMVQQPISPKTGLPDSVGNLQKFTQRNEARIRVLWAEQGVRSGTGRGEGGRVLIRIAIFTSEKSMISSFPPGLMTSRTSEKGPARRDAQIRARIGPR